MTLFGCWSGQVMICFRYFSLSFSLHPSQPGLNLSLIHAPFPSPLIPPQPVTVWIPLPSYQCHTLSLTVLPILLFSIVLAVPPLRFLLTCTVHDLSVLVQFSSFIPLTLTSFPILIPSPFPTLPFPPSPDTCMFHHCPPRLLSTAFTLTLTLILPISLSSLVNLPGLPSSRYALSMIKIM